jgi:hypothetical protein
VETSFTSSSVNPVEDDEAWADYYECTSTLGKGIIKRKRAQASKTQGIYLLIYSSENK